MNNLFNINMLIESSAEALGGVFTYADLAAITNTSEKTILPRKIQQLAQAGIILKFVRGFYLYPRSYDLQTLSQRLCSESYISLESILAKNLVIGTIPKYRLSAVKQGRSRFYQTKEIEIEHLSISPSLFFGFTTENGINSADPEKALLDCLYFYQKGRKLLFSIYEDINWNRLDRDKINSYLKRYKNPKFVKFVNTLLAEG